MKHYLQGFGETIIVTLLVMVAVTTTMTSNNHAIRQRTGCDYN